MKSPSNTGRLDIFRAGAGGTEETLQDIEQRLVFWIPEQISKKQKIT